MQLKTGDEADARAGVIRPNASHAKASELHEVETDLIQTLASELRASVASSKVVNWSYARPMAASVYAYVIASQRKHCYLIQPHAGLIDTYLATPDDDSGTPYEDALIHLATVLGTGADPARLVHWFERNGGTLFVLNAEYVPPGPTGPGKKAPFIEGLLSHAWASGQRQAGTTAPICLVGKVPDPIVKRVSHRQVDVLMKDYATRRGLSDAAKTKIRVEFFELQWRRFCLIRGVPPGDETDPRLKWAQWYYESARERHVYPMSIRMRAFLASNHGYRAHFDPTAGWITLAGQATSELPIDVRLALYETVVQARSFPERRRRIPELRALRWNSTAIYWLTIDAAKELTAQFSKSTGYWEETFSKAIQKMDPAVLTVDVEAADSVYKTSLTLKAVVQDRWKRRDPIDRAEAHFLIARRLWTLQHDKDALAKEFPLAPHWGRSRLIFLTECLRHLMRVCELVEKPEEKLDSASFAAFPTCTEPVPPLIGTDSRTKAATWTDRTRFCVEAVNFCFGRIYWHEMNGARAEAPGRKLSSRYGGYGLAAEVLQLMSQDGVLGRPHWALHPEHEPRFVREVALAQFGIGDLDGARRGLERLVDELHDELADKTDHVRHLLDLVVVLASRDELPEARRRLAEASKALAACQRVASAAGEAASPVARLEVRIRAELARLDYLAGKIEPAAEIFRALEREDRRNLNDPETAHAAIATFGALGKLKPDSDAMEKAHRLACFMEWSTDSEGLHHENLGFRIALAHIRRRNGNLVDAEFGLDGVYGFIQDHGCSEGTYLAFLLEAGRVVMSQQRYARAYTAYLRPCYERAKRVKFARIAETARRLAIACLEAIPDEIDQRGGEGDWATRLTALIARKGLFAGRGEGKPGEPKYTFGATRPERSALVLADAGAVARAAKELRAQSPDARQPARAPRPAARRDEGRLAAD